MHLDFKYCPKRFFCVTPTIFGWCVLLYIWYSNLISPDGVKRTLHTSIIIIFSVVAMFIFCYVWDKLNLDRLNFHNTFSMNFLKMKAPYWKWSEAIIYPDNRIEKKERAKVICRRKSTDLTASKRLSYAAILIRDGHIKEAIGFLRPLIKDPKVGQLVRKVAKAELEILSQQVFSKHLSERSGLE